MSARLLKSLPLTKPILRSPSSTGNLRIVSRALTSPAAAALKEYHQQPRQQDHHYTRPTPPSHLQNRSVHISTTHEPHHHILQTPPSSTTSTAFPPHPQPTASRPVTSANIFLSSLQRGGIDLTPTGTQALSQILNPVPFTSIDPSWLKTLDSAISTSHLNCPTSDHTNRQTGKRLQPPSSNLPWKEWVKYQVDGLVDRVVAMEGWDGVWNFEYLLMDEGLVVRGDEEVRRIMEVLVKNGWVVPIGEDGGEAGYEVVAPGRVGRFEGDRFAF